MDTKWIRGLLNPYALVIAGDGLEVLMSSRYCLENWNGGFRTRLCRWLTAQTERTRCMSANARQEVALLSVVAMDSQKQEKDRMPVAMGPHFHSNGPADKQGQHQAVRTSGQHLDDIRTSNFTEVTEDAGPTLGRINGGSIPTFEKRLSSLRPSER